MSIKLYSKVFFPPIYISIDKFYKFIWYIIEMNPCPQALNKTFTV